MLIPLNVYPLKRGSNISRKGYVLFATNQDIYPQCTRKKGLQQHQELFRKRLLIRKFMPSWTN
jgi:hypothetical protein